MLEKRRTYLPPLSLGGSGIINDLVNEIKAQGYEKTLIVTGKVLNQLGVAKRVTSLMDV